MDQIIVSNVSKLAILQLMAIKRLHKQGEQLIDAIKDLQIYDPAVVKATIDEQEELMAEYSKIKSKADSIRAKISQIVEANCQIVADSAIYIV